MEPPVAITRAMAFSTLLRVMMSRGLRACAHGIEQDMGRARSRLALFLMDVCHGGGAEQGHAERLERRAHRVGRVHAATGAGAGHGVAFDGVELLAADFAGPQRADGFERGKRD